MKKTTHALLFTALMLCLSLASCQKDSQDPSYFDTSKVGVCSWSWKADMTSILKNMNEMGITGIQLATTPWVAANLSDAQKEIFGGEESEEVLLRIKQLKKEGKLNIMSTMICFPHEDYSSRESIWDTSGFLFTKDNLGHDAKKEWEQNIGLVEAAAKMSSDLGVPYLSTEVGFLKKDWDLALERVAKACEICTRYGVLFLIESGQESGLEMVQFIGDLKKKYPKAQIGVNFDPANHLLYGTDTPQNAFSLMFDYIKQVHVKDALEDESRRAAWSEDILWGTGDVSQKYDFLRFVLQTGFKGNLLVEHEWGSDRAGDIKVALRAILGPQ